MLAGLAAWTLPQLAARTLAESDAPVETTTPFG